MNNTADGYVIYFQRIKMKNTWLKIEYWEFPQKILPHLLIFTVSIYLRVFSNTQWSMTITWNNHSMQFTACLNSSLNVRMNSDTEKTIADVFLSYLEMK